MGQKVKKVVLENAVTTTTDYLTGYQYKNTALQFFPTAEGYVNFTQASKGAAPTDTFNYAFNYVDHLGNVRLTYSQDPVTLALRIMEENHYYAFGFKHSGYNSDQMMYIKDGTTTKIVPIPPLYKTSYSYKYNGKELQDELGLNVYDYGNRLYDPARAGWSNIDPLAEKMRRFSPYNYCFNNPLRFTDPDGMAPDDVIIKGTDRTSAYLQLKQSVKDQLNLSIDSSGKVSYEKIAGVTPNADANQLINAIDDHSITVNLNTTASNELVPFGDAFQGNTVTKSETGNTVIANQSLNPNLTNSADTFYDKPGANTLHAITEGFLGAKISQASGVSAPPSINGIANPVYDAAHLAATSQSGPITADFVSAQGAVLPSAEGASRISIYVSKSNDLQEINSLPIK